MQWKTTDKQSQLAVYTVHIVENCGFLTTVTNNGHSGKKSVGLKVSFCKQVKTNCNTLQQMLGFLLLPRMSVKWNWITMSYKFAAKTHLEGKEDPLPTIKAQYYIGKKARLKESNPNRDGLTGKTVKACCIIQTHWQKLTQGQGCPRNHWNGRNNLHCICTQRAMRSNHMVLNTDTISQRLPGHWWVINPTINKIIFEKSENSSMHQDN